MHHTDETAAPQTDSAPNTDARPSRMGRRLAWVGVLALLLLAAGAFVVGPLSAGDEAAWAEAEFSGSKEEVDAFIDYYKSIELTAEQEQVRVDALTDMPAPCCSNFSAATCCCECNLSRSLWGLSKYLITQKDAGPEQVRAAAEAWVKALNPDGFSGRVCMTGSCGRPFKQDGCGGMSDTHVVY